MPEPLGNFAAEEPGKFLGIVEIQLEGDPLAGRLVQNRGFGLSLEVHPRVAPDQPVVLVGEPVAVPLADSADGVAQCRADGVDGVLGFGLPTMASG